jgi:broad specificity phosphatase PhoE
MPTTIHLVRHGHHPLLGRTLCGRMAGVALDERGRDEIAASAALLEPPPTIVQSSPQLRARQSAAILAKVFGVPVETVSEVDEIDIGVWTGRPLADLDGDPAWQAWNAHRGSARPPGGESMQELQARVVGHLDRICVRYSDETIAIVSHAEPIRAAILHYRQIRLDDFLSVEIETASVSTMNADYTGIQLTQVNRKVQG